MLAAHCLSKGDEKFAWSAFNVTIEVTSGGVSLVVMASTELTGILAPNETTDD